MTILYDDIESLTPLLNSFNFPIAIITNEYSLIFKNSEFNSSFINVDEINKDFIINNHFIKIHLNNDYFIVYKNQFDKGYLHDLNNLFTSLLNIYSIIKKKYFISEDDILNTKYLDSTHRIINFINNKLTLQNKSYFDYININSLLSDLISEFKLSINSSLLIDFEYDSEYFIKGNYDDLYRTLLNFLINAKEAISNNSGKIVIKLSKYNTFLNIEIIDSGIGILKNNLPFIFDNSFSTKEKKRISGLGLFEAKNIIEKHKGNILVESEENKGTKFTIILPLEELIANESFDIMLVDDDEIITDLLTDLIIDAGFSLKICADGVTAKYFIDNNKFRMLIVDKNIPNLSGIELIKYIRKYDSTIPIILATGSLIEEDETRGLQVTKVLTKPYLFDDLLTYLKNILK